ncbi:MAG: response regulator [Deltaproteobacteria bacterium]|nr:response regulator [Deltaproteobacteria bacterium]
MVVDDSPEFTGTVERFLEGKGYRVIVCRDGRSALSRLIQEGPEIVLLDLDLPDISGRELLPQIKKINPQISVVVVTGLGTGEMTVELMKGGAVDFLSKPVQLDSLLSAVKNALKLREASIDERRIEGLPTLESFFPFLAHEIRNPLHAIGGALAVIQRRSNLEDEPLAQSIRIIGEEVQHLNEFVQECLDFVRPVDTNYFVDINVNEVLSLVLNITQHINQETTRPILITTDLDPQLPPVFANYEEIKKAFLNIVKNSCEAMSDRGEKLKICTRFLPKPPSGWIEIVFSDQGAGIKKANLDKIFTPFFTTKVKGTGLGLAICHRIIVERHQGIILVESAEGQGTRFIVQLPLKEENSVISS